MCSPFLFFLVLESLQCLPRGQCWAGYGKSCVGRGGRPSTITVQGAQRIMHGEVRVLQNMSGWKIRGLFQLGELTSSPERGGEGSADRCRRWCYSDIGCQYWQYGPGGCWVDSPLFSTQHGTRAGNVVQDVKLAFDSMGHEELTHTLLHMGVSHGVVGLLLQGRAAAGWQYPLTTDGGATNTGYEAEHMRWAARARAAGRSYVPKAASEAAEKASARASEDGSDEGTGVACRSSPRISSNEHAAATERRRQLAKRTLRHSVFFHFHVLFSSLLDAVCVQSALLSDSGRSAPVERDRTSWRGVLHYALVSAIPVAFCVQLALLKEISATFQSLALARSASGHLCR
ncbi:unnamed protein product [Prorocentrum cordatum]|uniref:Uncharacterized protein n=1 Tax=Prorocentrum cordatum TaxID=2364126 RepID=A0ABN9WML0_9DINO|nr:unnamed protein product [Polarella glacialis]